MTPSKFPSHWNTLFGFGSESRLVWAKKPEKHAITQSDAPWVMNALANSLSQLENTLDSVGDPAEKADLSKRIENGKAYLNKLRTNLDSPSDLEESLDEWARLGFLSDFLKTPSLNYEGLSTLLGSDDIKSFLDKETLSKLVLADHAIETKKSIERTLRPDPIDDLMTILGKKWESARKNLDELVSKLPNDESREWYREELLKNQEQDKQIWIRKNLKKIDINGGKFQGYSNMVPQEAVEKIQILDLQAQAILQEMMAERLEKRLSLLTEESEKLISKWEHELAPETPMRIRKSLERASNSLHTGIRAFKMKRLSPADKKSFDAWRKQFDTKAAAKVQAKVRFFHTSKLPPDESQAELRSWIQRFEAEAEKTIAEKADSFQKIDLSPAEAQEELRNLIREFELSAETSLRETRALDEQLTEYLQNKSERDANLERKNKSVAKHMETMSSAESVAALKSTVENESPSEDDTIRHGQHIDAKKLIQTLADPNAEWKGDLKNQSPLKQLRAEEALAMESHVNSVYEKIDGAERTRLAREAMAAIAQAHGTQEILSALEKTVGSEHVEIVDPAEFEAKYRRYTTTGDMVFYQKGDFWKIIVNRDQKESPEDVDFLKKQVGHELRHLEFEGNAPLREAWVRAFANKLGSADWRKIKIAYLSRYPEKNPPNPKSKYGPFGPDDWKDVDLLSELYAMVPDFSELSSESQPLIQKGLRLAEFESNLDLKRKWTESFLSDADREKWQRVRDSMAESFPDLKSSNGTPIDNWSDADILSELYAIPTDSWGGLAGLSAAVAAFGLAGLERSSDSEVGRYFGAEAKKGKKGEDGDEEDDTPKTKSELESDLKEALGDIKKLQGSPFLSDLPGGAGTLSELKRHAEGLQKRLAGQKDDTLSGDIEGGLKQIQDTIGSGENSIKGQLMAISEAQGNPPANAALAFWKNTSFYSVADILAVFEHGKDYVTRWSKKQAGIHKGNLSKLVFEGVNEGLALEASSFVSGAWKEAIEEWEKRIKSKDASKLRDYLKDQSEMLMPDKALVCAIIDTMCEKGTMNWVDPNLWICLNKLQTDTKLDPNDKLLYEDEGYLREKLKKALGSPPVMNKKGAFIDRERKNSNAYDAKKREFVPVIQEAPGKIGERLRKMLINKKGTKEKEKPNKDIAVDPAEYEMTLEFAIKNGAYSPQDLMFYFLSGMACGLLKPNTGAKLAGGLWNEYPVMFYFARNAGQFNTTEKIKAFVVKHFKDEYEHCEIASKESKFRSFYWTKMVNDPGVSRRITKTAKPGGGSWDHDVVEGFAMCGDHTVFKTILSKSSSQVTEKTMPPNIYAGFLQWFEMNKNPSKKLLTDRIASYFAFKSIMSGAAYAKEGGMVRDSGIRREKPAGEASSTNHPKKPTSWVDNSLNHLMSSLPNLGPLFQLAIDQQQAISNPRHLDNIKTLLKTTMPDESAWIDSALVDLDHFYESIGIIVEKLLRNVDLGTLTAAIQNHLP